MTNLNGDDRDDHDTLILNARCAGVSVRVLAQRLNCSRAEINDVLDRVCEEITNKTRLRAIGLELERLDRITKPVLDRALEGDVPSAAILVKIAERRSALLGLDAPVKIDAVRVQEQVAPRPTECDEIEAILDRIAGKPVSALGYEDGGPEGGFVQ